MIIVTGGAGFIGSKLILGLNAKGREDILVVDDLTDGRKFRNLVKADIMDYWDIDEFLLFIKENKIFSEKIDAIFHQGACSTTTEWVLVLALLMIWNLSGVRMIESRH